MARTVLIVDDAEPVAHSLALGIEGLGDIKTVIAHHPHAALKLLNNDKLAIDALVTDFNLPALNGFELIRSLRQIAGYERIPAIMITAEEHAFHSEPDALAAPNAIFRKPFSIREVCRALEGLLT